MTSSKIAKDCAYGIGNIFAKTLLALMVVFIVLDARKQAGTENWVTMKYVEINTASARDHKQEAASKFFPQFFLWIIFTFIRNIKQCMCQSFYDTVTKLLPLEWELSISNLVIAIIISSKIINFHFKLICMFCCNFHFKLICMFYAFFSRESIPLDLPNIL